MQWTIAHRNRKYRQTRTRILMLTIELPCKYIYFNIWYYLAIHVIPSAARNLRPSRSAKGRTFPLRVTQGGQGDAPSTSGWAFRETPLRWIPASAGMTNCSPLGIKGKGWDHSPSFASFKHHSHHGSKALPLDSGFRRNDGRHPPNALARSEGGIAGTPLCSPSERGRETGCFREGGRFLAALGGHDNALNP